MAVKLSEIDPNRRRMRLSEIPLTPSGAEKTAPWFMEDLFDSPEQQAELQQIVNRFNTPANAKEQLDQALYFNKWLGIEAGRAFSFAPTIKRVAFEDKPLPKLTRLEDAEKALKEVPQNLRIGALSMTAGAFEAIKRRGMQLSGAGIFPDDDVRRMFEMQPPAKEQVRPRQDDPLYFLSPSPEGMPLPGAIAAEVIGITTRLPDLGSKIVQRRQQEVLAEQDRVTMANAPITRLMRSVVPNVPMRAIAIGIGVLTGDPVFSLGMMGEVEGGRAFIRQIEAGGSVAKSMLIADLVDAAEIGGEALVLPGIIKGFDQGLTMRQLLNIVAENAGQEGVTEFAQTFLEVVGIETTRNTPFLEASKIGVIEGIKAIPEGMFVGGVMAGGEASVAMGFGYMSNRVSEGRREIDLAEVSDEQNQAVLELIRDPQKFADAIGVREQADQFAAEAGKFGRALRAEGRRIETEAEIQAEIEDQRFERTIAELDAINEEHIEQIAVERREAAEPTITPEERQITQPETEGAAVAPRAEPAEAAETPYQKWYRKLGERLEKEAIGEDILDEMITDEVNVKEFNDNFWDNVYPELPLEQQRRFERYVQKETGFKPGDVIAYHPKTKEETIAKTWADIGKLTIESEKAEHLQGTERGLVVLEAIANNWLQQKPIEAEVPKQIEAAPEAHVDIALGQKAVQVEEKVKEQLQITSKEIEPTDFISPKNIEPPHPVQEPAKLTALTESMETEGWQGRPILVIASAHGPAAFTGSHRIQAAIDAGLETIPIYEIDATAIQNWLDETEINDIRLFNRAGLPAATDETIIPILEEIEDQGAIDLMKLEIELDRQAFNAIFLKTKEPAEAAPVVTEETEEQLSGITISRRRTLIKQTQAAILSDPVYQIHQDAITQEIEKFGFPSIAAGKGFAGEVAEAIQNHPILKGRISLKPTFTSKHWDAALAEIDEQGMDISEFLDRMGQALEAQQGRRVLNETAMDRALEAGNPFTEIQITKNRLLRQGMSDIQINQEILDIAERYEMEPDAVIDDLINPAKMKELAKMPEGLELDAELGRMAEQQILVEEQMEAQQAAKEVLEANDIVAEVVPVAEIKRPRPGVSPGIFGQEVISPISGEQAEFLDKKDFLLPEPDIEGQLRLPEEPADDIPFQRDRAGRILGAAMSQGEKELILLAYGADSETGYHEAYHIIKPKLTDKDLAIVVAAYPAEEQQARAFASYARGRAVKVSGPVKRVFEKLMRILRKIRSALEGKGFRTPEDIFGEIRTGKVQKAEGRAIRGPQFEERIGFEEQKLKTYLETVDHIKADQNGFLYSDGTFSDLSLGESGTHKGVAEEAGVDLDDFLDNGGIRVSTLGTGLNLEIWQIPTPNQTAAIERQLKSGVPTSKIFTDYTRGDITDKFAEITVEEGKERIAAQRVKNFIVNVKPKIRESDIKFETSGERLVREAEHRARVKARKARLGEQQKRIAKPKKKKGPAIRRMKIRLQDTTPPLRADLAPPEPAKPSGVLITPAPPTPKTRAGKRVMTDELLAEQRVKSQGVWKEALSDKARDTALGIEKRLEAMSARFGRIHPKLKYGVRQYVFDHMVRTVEFKRATAPMVLGLRKFSKDDASDFKFLARNSSFIGAHERIEALVAKYGLAEEWQQYRESMDQIYDMAEQVGLDMGRVRDYWPRTVKNLRGLLRWLDTQEKWSPFNQALAKRSEQAGGRKLTAQEKAQVINTLLRGFRIGGVSLSRPGQTKERTIEFYDKQIDRYYYGLGESVEHYIVDMMQNIGAREFFGKQTREITNLRAQKSRLATRLHKVQTRVGYKQVIPSERHDQHISRAAELLREVTAELEKLKGQTIEDSIGYYVQDLQLGGFVTADEQQQIGDMLRAIMEPEGLTGWARGFVKLAYLDVLNNMPVAMTQLEELGYSFHKDKIRALPAAMQAALGKSGLKLEDLGIDDINQYMHDLDFSRLAERMLFMMRATDRFGKQTFINTTLANMRAEASRAKPKAEFVNKLTEIFGPETQEVLEDLKAGRISDNVKFLAFNELADVQPIAITETPEAYARGRNWRLAYVLRQFQLKRLSYMRGIAQDKMSDPRNKPKQFVQGLKMLTELLFIMTLFGVGKDFIKDWFLGREFDLSDSVVENLLQYVLLSKYTVDKLAKQGPMEAVVSELTLPAKTPNAIWQDVRKGEINRTVRSIPFIGDNYYFWFGQGKDENGTGGVTMEP